ncbi:MAG: SoxR reducing system RseC family protein [Porticoccaceae bacterium]
MIVETGVVVALESDSLWVETIQKTACEACVAQKGCGTRVLSKLTGKTNRIRVLAGGMSLQEIELGQDVDIAIPEDVVVNAALMVYLLPVCTALFISWLSGSGGDLASIYGALFGLFIGGLMVRWHSHKARNDIRVNPVLFDSLHEKQVISVR